MDGMADRDLWLRYEREPGQALRAVLVQRYERLVRILAAKAFSKRFSAELEFDDYLQFGMVGLLESIDRYRVGEGARFETFASRRVTGAILDGVESLSEKQCQIASRQRHLKDRTASLHAGPPGLQSDVLERLGDIAVGLALGLLLEDSGLYAGTAQGYADNSYAHVELKQLQRRVKEALAALPEQERTVLRRHYFQQLGFDQIALDLHLSRGRISQIHQNGLRRMRKAWGTR